MLLDIHTHHLPEQPETALWSCCMKDRNQPEFSQARWISAGIHPWFLTMRDLPMQLAWLESLLSTDSRVAAIGEAGLDKLCSTPFETQIQAFKAVIGLSERYRLPLIVHAVKCFNELIALKRETEPSQAWIIHGFRGKKELAHSLLRQGFYLSVGEKFNPETVKAIPEEFLLAETDESRKDIRTLVRQMADIREEPYDMLLARLFLNAGRLFNN